MAYRHGKKGSRVPRRIWLVLACLVVLGVAGLIATRERYNALLKPVSSDQTSQIFTVHQGDSVKVIASNLQTKHLIRSAWAMELYVHSKELANGLQAGTYALSPSASTSNIVTTLTKGKVATTLVTILPGHRIDQVRADLINDGYTPASVDLALSPSNTAYAGLPILSYKPTDATSLEGLLWPDSYEKDAGSSDPSSIIYEALTAMGAHLTPDVQSAFASEGLSVYQGLTLTSIVTQEANKPSDQTQVAQVFLSRIKMGISLGSDVTAFYGDIIAGHATNDVTYDTPYNTRLHTGLPPTPISTITSSALASTTHPAATNWLFFVAGDDGTTYFATNQADHDAQTQKYCHKLCSQ